MTLTPSRRHIVKGVAWSAPALLTTTLIPAYAISTCNTTAPKTAVNWANFLRSPIPSKTTTDQSSFTGTVKTTDGRNTITATHTASAAYLSASQDLVGGPATSGTLPWTTYSGMTNYLYLQHSSSTAAQRSTLTLTFAQPVKNLSFIIGDIDYGSNWKDVLTVSGSFNGSATAAPTATGGATIATSGTTVTATATANNITYTSSSGNVTYTFSGPIDQVTISWINNGYSGAQNIVLGNTSMEVCI